MACIQSIRSDQGHSFDDEVGETRITVDARADNLGRKIGSFCAVNLAETWIGSKEPIN